MSFKNIDFLELITSGWEDSELYHQLVDARFLFVVCKDNGKGEYTFSDIFFHNLPNRDIDELQRIWLMSRQVVNAGVVFTKYGTRVFNNLPKASSSYLTHIRPYARNAADTSPLPDGRAITKQCFWLNNSYIERVVNAYARKLAKTGNENMI